MCLEQGFNSVFIRADGTESIIGARNLNGRPLGIKKMPVCLKARCHVERDDAECVYVPPEDRNELFFIRATQKAITVFKRARARGKSILNLSQNRLYRPTFTCIYVCADAGAQAKAAKVLCTNAADEGLRSSSRPASSADAENDVTAVVRATPGQKMDTGSMWYKNYVGFSNITRTLIFPANWSTNDRKRWAEELVAGGFNGVLRHLPISTNNLSGEFYAVLGTYLENGARDSYKAEDTYVIPRVFANIAVAGNDRGPENPYGDLRITVNRAITELQKHLSLTAPEKKAAYNDNVAAFKARLE